MGTASFTQQPNNSSDANFRAWGSALSTALQSLSGLTLTGDTGQINWTTVLAATATNTKQGYEIYRFNDTSQSTWPLFIRFDYGSGANVAEPAVWITIATTTNGAGVMGSQATTAKQVWCTSTTGNTVSYTSYLSSGPGRLMVCMWPNATTTTLFFWFLVERVLDDSGNPTSDTLIFAGNGSANQGGQVLPNSGVIQAAGSPLVLAPSTNALYGNEVGLGSFYFVKGRILNPPLGLLLVSSTYITGGSQYTLNVLNGNHNYLALYASVEANSGLFGLMRYE